MTECFLAKPAKGHMERNDEMQPFAAKEKILIGFYIL